MSTEIIKAVRELAQSKYNEGHGWQVIVECMEDSEIMEHLYFMKGNNLLAEITLESALAEMTEFAKAHTDHHDEIASTAW
jgi:hypothetical protein